MSTRGITNTGVGLNDIIAPVLNEVGFANNLENAFDNINDNFKILANHEFIKGAKGDSTYFHPVNVYDEENGCLTIWGERMFAAIKPESSDEIDYEAISIVDENDETKEFNWYDNLYSNPGNLYVIVDKSIADISELYDIKIFDHTISSLYYTFIDARYSAKLMDDNTDIYSTRPDKSCILMWNSTTKGFDVLSNAFPTIYYEEGVGLCWKLHGSNTGMPVKGLPGKDGASAVLQIVQCDELKYDNGLLVGKAKSVFNTNYGYVAFSDSGITKESLDGASVIVFAPLPKTEETAEDDFVLKHGFCFGQALYDVNENELVIYCHDDTIIDRSLNKNIINDVFKSINAYNNDISTGLSGLFIPISTPEKDNEKQPVHLLTALSPVDGDRKIRTEMSLLPISDIDGFQGKSTGISIDKYLSLRVKPGMIKEYPSNNIIRFKLETIVKDTNSEYLKNFPAFSENDGSDISEFDNAITSGTGLYCWKITSDASFNNVFTTELIPSVESKFLWVNEESKWTTEVFNFYKYEQVFNNSYSITDNTALNVDYDVNISGDNTNRSLSVSGNINCENLSSDYIQANEEYKNIYTTDEIVCAKGIKTVITDENGKPKTNANGEIDKADIITSIQDNGNITTIGNIDANSIKVVNDITGKTVSAKSEDGIGLVETNNLSVGSADNSNLLSISTNESNTIDITANNITNINITGATNDSIITTDTDVSITNNGIVSVTNNDVTTGSIKNGTFNEVTFHEVKSLFEGTNKSSLIDKLDNTKLDVNSNENYTALAKKSIYWKDIKDGSRLSHDKFTFSYNTIYPNNGFVDYGGYDYNDVNKRKVLQFILKQNSETERLNDTPLTIKFAKLGFSMGLYSGVSHGKWPVLVDTSYMKFKVVIEYSTSSIINSKDSVSYKFNNSLPSDNIKDGCSYAWNSGYDTKNSLTRSSSYYDFCWRHKSYTVSPYNIIISEKDILDNIAACYNAGGYVTISVYPEFCIEVKTQGGNRKCVDDVEVLRMYEKGNNTAKSYTMTVDSTYDTSGAFTNNVIANISTISYKTYNLYTELKDTNTSSLCNDGIVMKHGNTVFGLGFMDKIANPEVIDGKYKVDGLKRYTEKNAFTKEPALFYYTTADVTDLTTTNHNEYATDHLKYNQIAEKNTYLYLNAMPLREIFELIKHTKAVGDTWKKFGL